jgi:hypothetical protein
MDLDEIRGNLSSDKPTIRKKGKLALEDEVIRRKVRLSPFETMNLLFSVMSYEKKEIDALRSKSKHVTNDASQFFKQAVKYCNRYGSYISAKMVEFINYTVDILYDDTLPNSIKLIHKIVFIEILEPRCVYCIPFELRGKHTGWKKLFIYLKDALTDKRQCCDINNLKLLKGVCFNLYNDFHYQPINTKKLAQMRRAENMDDDNAIQQEMEVDENEPVASKFTIKSLMKWFKDTLLCYVEGDKDENSLLILSTVCDCLTSFLQYHNLNILSLLIEESTKTFFSILFKYFFQINSLQEKYFESFVNFLFAFFSSLLSILLSDNIFYSALVDYEKLYPLITSLYEGMISDEFLLSLLLSTKKKQSRKPNLVPSVASSLSSSNSAKDTSIFVNLLETEGLNAASNSCYVMSYLLLVKVTYFHLMLQNQFNSSHEFFLLPSSSSDVVRDRNGDDVSEEDSRNHGSPRKRLRLDKVRPLTVGFHRVFDRISSISLVSQSNESILSQTDSKITAAAASKRPVHQLFSLKSLSFAVSFGNNASLLESLLLLVVSACQECPNGEFLRTDERVSVSEQLQTLCTWLSVVCQHLAVILQFKEEKQLLGTILIALVALLNVSHRLLLKLQDWEDSETSVNRLKDVLMNCCQLIVENERNFFKVMNSRVVGINSSHYELFKLLSALLHHPVMASDEQACTSFLFSLSSWQVFQLRRTSAGFSTSVETVDGNLQEAANTDEIEENVLEESYPTTFSACLIQCLNCPYYLRVLSLICCQLADNTFSLKQTPSLSSFAAAGQNYPLLFFSSWLFTLLGKCFEPNYSTSSSFFRSHHDDVLRVISLFCDLILEKKSAVISDHFIARVMDASREWEVNWFLTKDLHWFVSFNCDNSHKLSLYPDYIDGSSGLPHLNIFQDILENLCASWKRKLLELTKGGFAPSDQLISLFRCGTYLLLPMMHCARRSKTPMILCYDIIEQIFSSIELCLLSLSLKDVSVVLSDLYAVVLDNLQEISREQAAKILSSISKAYHLLKTISASSFSDKTSQRQGGSNEDDFLDEVSSSAKGNDDFFEVSAISAKLRQNTGNLPEFNVLDTFSFLCYCWNICSLLSSEAYKARVVNFSTFVGQYIHGVYNETKYSESELILLFAEKLSQLSSSSIDYELIVSILNLYPWNKLLSEWSHFAYVKLLIIISGCFANKEFWDKRVRSLADMEDDIFLKYAVQKLFPEENSIEEKLFTNFWKLRSVQLECVVSIMRHVDDISSIKMNISSVFLSAIVDVDLRVRHSAVRSVSSLLRHFKSPLKAFSNLYNDLQDVCSAVLSEDEGNSSSSFDKLEIALLFLLCTKSCQTGPSSMSSSFSASDGIVIKAVKDLLCFVYPYLNDNSSNSGDIGKLEKKKLIFREYLLKTFTEMAASLGYPCRHYFITDYLKYMLSLWIDLSYDENSSVSSPGSFSEQFLRDLGFTEFPYELVFEEFLYFDSNNREVLYSVFLNDYSHIIVSSIIRISHPRIRWAYLTSYCRDLFGNDSDNEIHKTIQQNFISCKSSEITLLIRSQLLLKENNVDRAKEMKQSSEEISKFLSRLFTVTKDISSQLKKDSSTILNELLLYVTLFPESADDSILLSSASSSKELIVSFLQYLLRTLNYSQFNQLLYSVNLLDFISNLFHRVKTSQLSFVTSNAISFLIVIGEQSDVFLAKKILFTEVWKILFYVISLKAVSNDLILLITDFYNVFLRKIIENTQQLSLPSLSFLLKDLLFQVISLYFVLFSSAFHHVPTNNSPDLLSSYLLSQEEKAGGLVTHCRVVGDVTAGLQRLKEFIHNCLQFIQENIVVTFNNCQNNSSSVESIGGSEAKSQSVFLFLVPQVCLAGLQLSPHQQTLFESTGVENGFKTCYESMKEIIGELLSGVDIWPNFLFLLLKLEEIIENESQQVNNSSSASSETPIEESFYSHLFAVCDYISANKTTNFLLSSWSFRHLPILIANLINKLKYLQKMKSSLSVDSNISFSLLGDGSHNPPSNSCAYYPLNSAIKCSQYDVSQLQKLVILLIYKKMGESHSANCGLSCHSIASQVLNNLAIQTYFAEDVSSSFPSTANSQVSTFHTIGMSSQQHSSGIDQNGSCSLSFLHLMSYSNPLDYLYENISSFYSLSLQNSQILSIFRYNYSYDNAFGYEISDGNADFIHNILANPLEALWNEQLWQCEYYKMSNMSGGVKTKIRRKYSNWIKGLVYCLIQYFLHQVKTNLPSAGKSSKSSKPSSSSSQKSSSAVNNKLLFLFSCSLPMTLLSTEISEILFLLLVSESIDIFSVNSLFVTNLFDFINRFIIKNSTSDVCPEAKTLVSHLFCLLFQKTIVTQAPMQINEIGEYQQASQQAVRLTKDSKALLHVKFAFQYHSSIDLLNLVETLLSKDLLSSALLFAELIAESYQINALSELKTKIHQLSTKLNQSNNSFLYAGKSSSALLLLSQQNNEEIKKDQELFTLYRRLQGIFHRLYRSINDIDMMEAIDSSFHLPLQAFCYQRKEHYFEALTTYESILQIQQGRNASYFLPGVSAESQVGRDDMTYEIAETLKGLGASSIQSSYLESVRTGAFSSSSSFAKQQLSEWNLDGGLTEESPFSKSSSKISVDRIHSDTSSSSSFLLKKLTVEQKQGGKTSSASTVLSVLLPYYQKAISNCTKLFKSEKTDAVHSEILHLYDYSTIWNVYKSSQGSGNLAAGLSSLQRTAMIVESTLSNHSVKNMQKTFDFLTDLLSNSLISGVDCLSSVNLLDGKIHSSTLAHTLSPSFYRCWDAVLSASVVVSGLSSSDSSTSLQRTSKNPVAFPSVLSEKELVPPFIQLQECRLLWKKGLSEAALDRLNTVVLPVLSEIFKKAGASTSAKSSGSSSRSSKGANGIVGNDSYLSSILSDVYSESLRLNGIWSSSKGSKASNEIIRNNLEPSVQYASSLSNKIQSLEALASFTSSLFTNIQQRIHSIEWIQSERVFHDREEELKACLELQQQGNQGQSAKDINNAQQIQENRNLLRHIVMLKKEIDMDKKERNHLLQSYNNYLLLSIENYLKILYLSTDNDIDIVFRFINLWFKNNNGSSSSSASSSSSSSSITVNIQAMNDLIIDYLSTGKILSYKFIPLHYQIFSRLGQQSSTSATEADSQSFQKVLQKFIFLLCEDHPHHVIPQLFALIHDKTVDSMTYKSNNQSNRSEMAENILKTLLSSTSSSTGSSSNSSASASVARSSQVSLIKSMQIMLESYHELAKTSTEALQSQGKTKNIKFKEIQSKGKRFNEFLSSCTVIPAVITLSSPINRMKRYESGYNLIRIKEFDPAFHITENGISRPKIVKCLGENGIFYKQLVKGGDDMRQDAVMEQVFENINYTLQRNPSTFQRNLLIRTYKVIPLTPQTGILQWVENTLPFGAILCDRMNGLHTRYQYSSTDYSHKECRELLQKCIDNQEKEKKFSEIMNHFHPCFHYFFLEKFSSNSMEWFNKRNHYIKSVATNSMTGYILGIGDRHAHNILIDQITGECVHIDFGIVFEQGKGLGTPETVPFRLTRDIIDGMGINGVEGMFRRCCEEVLKVLRENSFNLFTILEVVIYDPLYKWSLSPLKARNKQLHDGNDDPQKAGGGEGAAALVPDFHENVLLKRKNIGGRGGNKATPPVIEPSAPANETKAGGKGSTNFGKDAAERTLMKIKNKLRGYEDLSFDALTVEGHVDMLINEAKDPTNLCRIFPGWAPWL